MTAVNPNPGPASSLASLGTLAERNPALSAAAQAVPTQNVGARPPPTMLVSADEVAKPSREAVDQAARHIQSFVQSVGRSLNFSVDQSTGQTVLRVINPDNGELIRQLPGDETLRIAKAIDYMQSMLVNQRA
jgi:flagellar protein FlaG